ncbi:MAG TPA: signal peptidase I [Vicinamibacterales bacterium]
MTIPQAGASATSPMRRRLTILAAALFGLSVIGALVVVMGFPIAFHVARIEGQAMSPTLRDQDRLLVDLWAYRATRPGRGDIVMMRYPRDASRLFVKRVIAEPGEQLHIRDGHVFVDGTPLDESYVLPAFRSHDDWGPETVPQDSYFVMGDRRNNSSDSRHWGFVPAAYIVGRVTFRWFPFGEMQQF